MSEFDPGDLLRKVRAEQEVERDAEACRSSLATFIRQGWHVLKPQEPYLHNWHIDAVCEHLMAVTSGQIKRLQVWVPPGTSKTMLVSVFWPAWEWTDAPHLRYWSASYETRLAGRISAMSRDLMLDPWYRARWGDVFRMDRDAEHYFSNDKGGTRLSTAPNSTGSGEHGHRIIIDDPINAKSADATSRITLDETNNWYDGTVVTRGIGNDHARVIVMQRLHENDLAAHVLEAEPWEVLCLPERYEPMHPYAWTKDPRTHEGELLDPGRRNDGASNALARSLTAHRAAGQLQQRPSAKEGEILKRDDWRFYDARVRANETWADLPQFSMVVETVDCPVKDKETNDNVAIQMWGVHGADAYLLDLRLGKMSYAPAKRAVKDMAVWGRRTWPRAAHFVLIENAGYGVEMIIDLKRELTGIQKITPAQDGDKVTRAMTAADGLESHNYFLPGYGKPWQPAYDEQRTPEDVAAFIQNCAAFPNAAHDDDVDAWSQFGNWRRTKTTARMRTSSAIAGRR